MATPRVFTSARLKCQEVRGENKGVIDDVGFVHLGVSDGRRPVKRRFYRL